ncbi:putative circularly permuted ATP-grasp superfamily protein/putative alpha-E superfamily protein [Sphingobium sp. OAS761]|uniref:circularly permuted type 2 ATP-grasp protein n=1 Tax=Sphingobium sp. OAS761 TaxID=2817901 RepID=UPI00209ED993|nr:circularly permuted type 2 ATP-grasp protein [Sphingobium sp. OAS761]MCP1469530.1 putative circularly permuted ATP-grasp superfamily protein/putative alpha-E superfamily protein [Sphingobium sp. OAS761]
MATDALASPVAGKGWADAYLAAASRGDLFADATPAMATHWHMMLERLSTQVQGDPAVLADHVARQATALGMAFRLTGDEQERAWPLGPVPLLIGAEEWTHIERGLTQRAELLDRVVADIYSTQSLVREGKLPASIVTGSPHYWRVMTGTAPPHGHYLHFYAADICRGPNGEWRVLADRVRTPVGVGYALENRLALSRATGDLLGAMNTRRLAPFFTDLRGGLAADCVRSEPRIGLLTPGRFNQSYAEQAHLARYLGLLLVEGDDLIVSDGRLFVRTIQGLKRVDGLWRWMDTRFMDPLAFDGGSRIGVPDLYDACARGGLMIGNWPGAGVIESRALAAFLPKLARAMLGADLILPNIATWWCGQPRERAYVRDRIDQLVIGSAFGQSAAGLAGGHGVPGATLDATSRATLMEAMTRRPMDYVGQEMVRLSTTPAVIDGRLAPLPFSLRVFVARDAQGQWRVMPGAFARLAGHDDIRAALMGEGDMSADMCVVDARPVPPDSLLGGAPAIRRVGGMLPAKAADNLFWLGRYIERTEMVLRMIRTIVGGSIEADLGPSLASPAMARLVNELALWHAVPGSGGAVGSLCAQALGDARQPGSVRALMGVVANIGEGLRDRLASDFWRLVRLPLPRFDEAATETLLDASSRMIERISALSGLAAENMGRTEGWRFHDMGRRMERAINGCRLVSLFGGDDASADDLTVLLDLTDSQISYRTRYLTGPALAPVRDLVALEPQNPRAIVWQAQRLADHIASLPTLRNDGMPEEPRRLADALAARLSPLTGDTLTMADIADAEHRLTALSDAIGQRYFLQVRKTQSTDLLA